MSASGGTKAVVAALLANAGIAIAKFVGFLVTGSSSMLAESVHSVADSGNQGLLLVGGRRARRAATVTHPFGYGRERYFYAFVVALVLFSLGSLFSLYEAWHKYEEAVEHPEKVLKSPAVALVILGVAIVLESLSFRTAIQESNKVRGTLSWTQFIRRAKQPELPVVLLEDLGALVGLVLAFGGVGLAALTGDIRWDAAGTAAIGVLLGVIAIVLIFETKSLLLGESAGGEVEDRIRGALVDGEVTRVIHLRTQHLGPDELLVGAKIQLAARLDVEAVARAIDAAEDRVRSVVPEARVMYLEPDLYREPAAR